MWSYEWFYLFKKADVIGIREVKIQKQDKCTIFSFEQSDINIKYYDFKKFLKKIINWCIIKIDSLKFECSLSMNEFI